MSYTYDSRKKASSPAEQTALPSSEMEALRSGARRPTAEQMGHRVDLPDAMREKMESAFGADLSAVKLYESQAVADAGAGAMAQGTNIAFAPGMLDFTSFGGQALLGHEISHVVSQSRGEVTGSGFLNDHVLEARADREGAMAAAGQQVAMPTASLSPVTAAPAAAPMQAGDKAEKKLREHRMAEAMYRVNDVPLDTDDPLDDTPTDPAKMTAEQKAEAKASMDQYMDFQKQYKHHKKWGDFWEYFVDNDSDRRKKASKRHKVRDAMESEDEALALANYHAIAANNPIRAKYYGWLADKRGKKVSKLTGR